MVRKSGGWCDGGSKPASKEPTEKEIKTHVREYYAAAVSEGEKPNESAGGSSCCASASASDTMKAALRDTHASRIGYSEEELASIPEHAATHAFGCGNPLAFSGVKEGDVVLDLGSGAGIDVLLASKKVGPLGQVIGLDMTPEMIEKASENAREANATNVEFRLGEMEAMPVESSSVDWVISNCVVNLSPDKVAVFGEVFRVLKPGGRILISDICVNDIKKSVRDELFQWADCMGGALDEVTYLRTIERAGFVDVAIVDKKTFSANDVRAFLEADKEFTSEQRAIRDPLWRQADHKVSSIRVYARKRQ